jgi:Spy/CpxP family protein refolding chaperone
MIKKTILIMAIMLVFVFGSLLDAKPRSQMMRHSGFNLRMVERNLLPARMLLRMKAEIGLTTSQVNKIEKMQLDYKEFVIKSSADVKLIGLKMKTEFNADKVNRVKVINLIKKIASLKTEMQISRINYLLDVKSILTKEQMVKIDTLRKNRRTNMMQRRNNRRKSMNSKMRGKNNTKHSRF